MGNGAIVWYSLKYLPISAGMGSAQFFGGIFICIEIKLRCMLQINFNIMMKKIYKYKFLLLFQVVIDGFLFVSGVELRVISIVNVMYSFFAIFGFLVSGAIAEGLFGENDRLDNFSNAIFLMLYFMGNGFVAYMAHQRI